MCICIVQLNSCNTTPPPVQSIDTQKIPINGKVLANKGVPQQVCPFTQIRFFHLHVRMSHCHVSFFLHFTAITQLILYILTQSRNFFIFTLSRNLFFIFKETRNFFFIFTQHACMSNSRNNDFLFYTPMITKHHSPYLDSALKYGELAQW